MSVYVEESIPQYVRISVNIAARIAKGQLKEGDRLYGRSTLSSEFGVSPETVRRALRLLAEMKIVQIKEKSGVSVLSADNARRYLCEYEGLSRQNYLITRLKELYQRQNSVHKEMGEIYEEILKTQSSPLPEERNLPNYEALVPEGSAVTGKSIGQLKFWQNTGATIVAIKRNMSIVVSPGPYAEIYEGDILVFVCAKEDTDRVLRFVNEREIKA
ncbi:MAG: GntR family transcriptional regulator [Lachnospiraceae bacterium]|nr:GntR family transcriptional regulator [Lachnospiraceae bacterium]